MQDIQEMQVQSLGQEDPLEKEIGYPPWYYLENSIDRGACRAAVHEVAKSRT